jgi:hypothetical protein
MKNKLTILSVLLILSAFVLGCGQIQKTIEGEPSNTSSGKSDSSANKSLSDKVIESTVAGEKIGIPECDELMDYFTSKIDNEETDFITKAFLKTLESQFRQGIKKNLEENKSDKAETAKFCKEFKAQIDKEEAKQKK